MSQTYPPPRKRRSDKYQGQPAAPQRPSYQEDEAAPLPLGGYDAANAPAGEGRPAERRAPKVYDERSYSPPPVPETGRLEYDGYFDDEELPPRRWPWVILLVVLLAAVLLASSYFLIPKGADGLLGKARGLSTQVVDGALGLVGLKKNEPPQLIKFDTPASQVQTGVKTVFTFTANTKIDAVRIRDEVNTEIKGVAEAIDAPDNTTWTLTAILDREQTLLLSADILVGGTWYLTDKSLTLSVAAPTATPEPTATAAPVPTVTVFLPAGLPPETTDAPVAPTDAPQAQEATPGLTLADLLPAFTPAPDTAAAPEFPEEELPADMLVEFPKEELPADMMAEFPEEELPTDMMAEFPEEELPADMMAEFPEEELPADMMAEFPDEELPEDMLVAAEPAATPAPAAPATPSPMPALSVAADENQAPGKFSFNENTYIGSKRQDDFTRAKPINMQAGTELYTYYEGGVFTFRNDGMRQNAAFGQADMPLDQMSVRWEYELGSLRTKDGTVYGLGWTGQPAIVKWSVETRSGMNINDDKKDVKALKEVIAAAQDGKVYFLDLADGLPTREAIDIGYPLKGSVSVDPFGRPLVAFGQGASIMPNKTGPIGLHFYNLVDQSEAYFLNGRKTKTQLQYSTNGAFDGNGLFDRGSDTFIIAGENGLLYTVLMNTVYEFKNPGSLTIDPETAYLRAKAKQDDATVSVESSPAMYGPYAFYADKRGLMRAVDTNSMETLWVFDTGDNTDATPALDLTDGGGLALYTGTTVHARTRRDGMATLRRLDALTGREAWAVQVAAKYDVSERGGLKASPVVGQSSVGDLVFFTVNLTEDGATVLALNKDTGAQAWKAAIPGGAISSPVAVYTQDGRARLVQAGLDGKVYLLDARTGSALNILDLGGAIEGSPAVYSDTLVIGTASKDNHKLYGIRLE